MLSDYIKGKKGITLVEVMVGAALITFVLGAFISAFYYGANLRTNSRKRLDAVLTAQAYIEEIRSVRGEISSEWETRSELEEWLVRTMSFSEAVSGEFVKDNVTITLEEIAHKLFILSVEVHYSDEMNKGKVKAVVLETRLGEL